MAGKKETAVATKAAKANVEALVVVDVGFGFLKFFSNFKKDLTVMPSTIYTDDRAINGRVFNNKTINLDQLVVEVDGVKSYVGSRALDVLTDKERRTRIHDRANDPMSRILFQTAIALSLPDESGTYDDIRLITGLPNKDLDNSVIVDNLRKFILEPFTIKFYLNEYDFIEKHISVSSVKIIRQPEGTVMFDQFEFTDMTDGRFLLSNNEDVYVKYAAVLDIGHVTSDFSLVIKGEIDGDDKTSGSTKGVSEVYRKLKKTIPEFLEQQGEGYHQFRDVELDTAIKTGFVHSSRLPYDVKDLIQEAVSDVATNIVSVVFEAWEDELPRLERIIITGGGAELFTEALEREFKMRSTQKFEVIEGAQFANVLGYYMYGVLEEIAINGEEYAYENYVQAVFVKPEPGSEEE